MNPHLETHFVTYLTSPWGRQVHDGGALLPRVTPRMTPPVMTWQVHEGGGCWLLIKKGALDGVVEEKRLLDLPEVLSAHQCQVLFVSSPPLTSTTFCSVLLLVLA